MHPQPPAPIWQLLHRQAVVHLCGARVVDGNDAVVRQVDADACVRVRGRSSHQAGSSGLRRTASSYLARCLILSDAGLPRIAGTSHSAGARAALRALDR